VRRESALFFRPAGLYLCCAGFMYSFLLSRSGKLLRLGVLSLAVISMLAAIVGVPLPIVRLKKDRSIPFPCMDRPCGCANAESCWRKCCCHTNAEKIAWAQKNNVTPPDYVIAAVRSEVGVDSPKCCCCSKKAAASPVNKLPKVESHQSKSATENDRIASLEQLDVALSLIKLDDLNRCQGKAKLSWLLTCIIACNLEAKVVLQAPLASWTESELTQSVDSPPVLVDSPPPKALH